MERNGIEWNEEGTKRNSGKKKKKETNQDKKIKLNEV